MLKYPKSIREIIPTDYNFFINPCKKINLKNISRYLIPGLRKKSGECGGTIFEIIPVNFFKNPLRRQFDLKAFKPIATLIIKQFFTLNITSPGTKDDPESAISSNFALMIISPVGKIGINANI